MKQMAIFDFFQDMYNYDSRVVDSYDTDSLTVDTCKVSDGNQPYETGVLYPEAYSSEWIIVEAYDNAELAQAGHNKWVHLMTTFPLPEVLIDCQNAEIAQCLPIEKLTFKLKEFSK